MQTLFYSTGKAALALGVTQERIRDLCAAGAIQAEVTDGGHWRISTAVVEGLKRDGLPPLPRPLPGDNPRPRPPSASPAPGLVAEPSPDVVAAHEEADITAQQVEIRRHKVEGLKLHKEAVELGDFFRARRLDREQAAADKQAWADTQARAERAQQEAIRAEQRRREWMNGWLAFALDAPNTRWRWEWSAARDNVEVEAAIHDEVLPILEKTSSDEPDDVVKALVLAAVERVIARWQRGNEIQQILTSAGTDWLPYAARGTSAGLSIWQVRSMEAADAAMRGLRADASIEELRCVAKAAAKKVVAEFEHLEACENLVRDLRAQVQGATADELEGAKKEVGKALAGLPLTASQHDRERARDGAIASLRQRIAARQAEAEAAAQRIQDRATRQDLCRLGPWILPWDFPAEQNPPAAAAVAKALDALPEGAPQAQLEEARTAALAPFIAAHALAQRKQHLIAGGLRQIGPYIAVLEKKWEFIGKSAAALEAELGQPLRMALEKQLSGSETPEEVGRRVRQLVRNELDIAPSRAA